MANEARLRYGTFDLGSPDVGGVVHLRSELPEVVAVGTDAMLEMIKGIWPLGGPHCEVAMDRRPPRFHVVTPECEFTYEHLRTEKDTAGWYFLFRLVYTSDGYQTFLALR